MRNTKIFITCAAMVALGLSACKKSFINKVPESNLVTQNFYKTSQDAESALTGAYQYLTQGSGFYQYDNHLFTDGRSDNCYVNGDDNVKEWPLETFSYTAGNVKISGEWETLYAMIAQANSVLDNVPNITDPALTATRKAQILAEARFLRALNYYWLVTEWGPTPLVLTTNYKGNYTPKRAAVADVYAQIIADLQFADANLDAAPVNGQKGRATQGAADALLAKVYAQMGDYTNCLTYCNKVINGGQYSLVADYANLFGAANNNNSESIFEIEFDGNNTYNWGNGLFVQYSDGWPKRNIGSYDLIQAFTAEGDNGPRYQTTFQWQAPPATLNMPANAWGTDATKPVPYCAKYLDFGTDDIVVIRLADIILLAAEANVQLNNLVTATSQLNQIRTRAGVANTIAITKNDLALAVLNERRLELVNECHRWNDLLRANANGTINILTLMNNQHDATGKLLQYGIEIGGVPQGVTQSELLFPIGTNELQLNPNLTQNPGY